MRTPKRKPETEPIHLTEEGIWRLQAKLRKTERELPELIKETQRTAAYGDRSDNAEYKDAKSKLRRANWQILSIKDRLKRVEVIKSEGTGYVQLGSTVTVESDGQRQTFLVLGTYETNPSRGKISDKSPLGQALMGRMKGTSVEVKLPSGIKEYKIVGIK